MVDGQDGAQEVEQLITEDWSYIAEVVDSRYELEDIQQSLQDQRSPKENFSLMRVTEGNFKQMPQSTAQMQQRGGQHRRRGLQQRVGQHRQ